MIEINKENPMEGIYDRNEIMSEFGEVDLSKATHRIKAFGLLYVNQIKDYREPDLWRTLPGIFADSIQADEAYKKFKEQFG